MFSIVTMYCVVLKLFVSASLPALTIASGSGTNKPTSEACILPEYPEHGTYVVQMPQTHPGQSVDAAVLNYTCQEGYRIAGNNQIICVSGIWSQSAPKCIRFCKLERNPSVEYKCRTDGQEPRDCNEYEPSGAIVLPQCRRPNNYSVEPLRQMTCIDGQWDHIATCVGECGTIHPRGVTLLLAETPVKNNDLPWHASIYTKRHTPYMQICEGALISSTMVVSAAHCFWRNDSPAPKEDYAVALGKVYRPWNYQRDNDAHKSDVKDIHIAPHFRGASNNYASDIALVVMEQAVTYTIYIRPICVDFDINFQESQLRAGNLGKIGVWNIGGETNNKASRVLKIVEIPYVDLGTCLMNSPPYFRPFITSDKFCAGFSNGTLLCRGASGLGLGFPSDTRGVTRYYLRGIMSTGPLTSGKDMCQSAVATFTNINSHEHFIKNHLDNL